MSETRPDTVTGLQADPLVLYATVPPSPAATTLETLEAQMARSVAVVPELRVLKLVPLVARKMVPLVPHTST